MQNTLIKLAVAALITAGFTPATFDHRAPTADTPLLITAAELSRTLRDPALVLLHVGPKEDYDAGHIPGARLVTMNDLAAPRTPGAPTLELPDEATLRAKLEALGISDNSKIVVVPGVDWGSPATRIVFTLDAAGLGDRTRLLDGGSAGWQRAGLPVTTDVPAPAKPGRLTVAQNRSIVVGHAWLKSQLGSKDLRLIDARAPMFFDGPGMKDPGGMNHDTGHIPGARNVPFNTLYNDSLQILPVDQLRRVFTEAGVKPGETIVAYCHIGQQATVVLFTARILGHPVKLYDGSFTEWESLKLPTEKSYVRPPTFRY